MGIFKKITEKFIRSNEAYKGFQKAAESAPVQKTTFYRADGTVELKEPAVNFKDSFKETSETFIEERGNFADKYVPAVTTAVIGLGVAAGIVNKNSSVLKATGLDSKLLGASAPVPSGNHSPGSSDQGDLMTLGIVALVIILLCRR